MNDYVTKDHCATQSAAVLEKLVQWWGVQVQRANGLGVARRLGAEW